MRSWKAWIVLGVAGCAGGSARVTVPVVAPTANAPPAYRARLAVDESRSEDIVVAGVEARHRHACETLVMDRVDALAGPPVEAHVLRACATAPLPELAHGHAYLLVTVTTIPDAETWHTHAGPPIAAVVTSTARFNSAAACDSVRARMIARNARVDAAESQESGSWIAGQQAQAEAERAARCNPVAEVRTRCDALRANGAKAQEDLSEREIEQKDTERACTEATTMLQAVVEYRKTAPPPAPPPRESPPICRAE